MGAACYHDTREASNGPGACSDEARCAQMPRPGYSLTAPHPEPCKAMTIRWNKMQTATQN
jgi:hypothetical protein